MTTEQYTEYIITDDESLNNYANNVYNLIEQRHIDLLDENTSQFSNPERTILKISIADFHELLISTIDLIEVYVKYT